MFPVLFEFGGVTITSFGVMMALAFWVGGQVMAMELRRYGEDPEIAWDLVIWAALVGLLGAKLYYLLLTWPDTVRDPWRAITSRGGLVWYGGFIPAAVLVAWRVHRLGRPLLRYADVAAPVLAIGYAIGRLGCFLVGDDYGRPTDLSWGVAFPQGAPPSTAGNLRRVFGVDVPGTMPDSAVLAVHPTQLYEVGMALVMFAILWRFRLSHHRPGAIFALYLLLAGMERSIVELFRAKDDRFFGYLSLAQLISLFLVLLGTIALSTLRSRTPATLPA